MLYVKGCGEDDVLPPKRPFDVSNKSGRWSASQRGGACQERGPRASPWAFEGRDEPGGTSYAGGEVPCGDFGRGHRGWSPEEDESGEDMSGVMLRASVLAPPLTLL